MKRLGQIFLCLFVFSILRVSYSQETDALPFLKDSLPPKKWYETKAVRISIAPAAFFTAGALTWSEREGVRETRNRYIPDFEKSFDDYTKFLPTLAVYGLNAAGVKGKHSVQRATVSYAFSMGIMGILVNGLKYTTKVERPDGSSKNSFPSGHTASAFTNATFLHKEYGQYRSGLYTIGGYATAVATGFGRVLNNRHWISDVMVGAGIGILSTELGYIIVDQIYKEKGLNQPLPDPSGKPVSGRPSFLEIKFGYADAVSKDLTDKSTKVTAEHGFNLGFEGAWFFHRNIGIGGEWSFVSFPMSSNFTVDDPDFVSVTEGIYTEPMGLRTIYAGPYFSLPLPKNWFITAKITGGSASGAQGDVIALIRDEFEDEFGTKEIPVLRYDPKSSVGWKTGIGIQRRLSRNVALKLYADYNYTKQDFEVLELSSIDDQGNYQYTSLGVDKVNFNYIAVGLAFTAFLW